MAGDLPVLVAGEVPEELGGCAVRGDVAQLQQVALGLLDPAGQVVTSPSGVYVWPVVASTRRTAATAPSAP
ncbi:hypothetical protein ACR6C2_07705 [Streptomyces sp. INA 01156]